MLRPAPPRFEQEGDADGLWDPARIAQIIENLSNTIRVQIA
jgi:hypothetical protein